MSDVPNVDDVCRALGISRSTWDRWRVERLGPKVIRLPNGSQRIRPADLEAWLGGWTR